MTANISQLKSIYSYLQQSGIGASATSSSDGFVNTIWSSFQDIEGIANGNDQQKTAGIQNILDKVMGLIEKFAGASNEAGRASKEVKANGADARELNADATQKEQEMVAEIERIKAEIQGHIDVITTATANINGQQENLDKQLEALQSIQEQIQQKQDALKNLDKNSPDYKKNAETLLNDIKGLAGLVPAITGTITGIQELCTTESQNVANAYTAVETLKGNAVEVQTNGQEQIINLSAKAIEEVKDNASSNITAVRENVPTSEVSQQAGQAAASNVFTAAEAPKLFQVSVDQKLASTTRITGSANNLLSVQQGIGKINSSNEKLTGFSGEIEAQLNAFNTALGNWDAKINPMIESIGSINYEEIAAASEELVEAVDEDLATIKSGVDVSSSDEEEQSSESQEGIPAGNVLANLNPQADQLKTIGFDMSRLGLKKEEVQA